MRGVTPPWRARLKLRSWDGAGPGPPGPYAGTTVVGEAGGADIREGLMPPVHTKRPALRRGSWGVEWRENRVPAFQGFWSLSGRGVGPV